jgi:formylmethanofuran dehydrogenase subunit C
MAQIHLVLKQPVIKPKLPVEAEIISPDNFSKKSIDEIQELLVWRGNKQVSLSELFDFKFNNWSQTDIADIDIKLEGDLSKFKRIGQKMTNGSIQINGSVGMHLGYLMKGGKISLIGNADDFAGANMNAGELIITGNAGHYLGGSTRGDWRGMNGGKIKVTGNVGNECGVWMRKGLIEILGDAQMFLGIHMHKGTILVHGNVTERAGAEMTGGVIVIQGKLSRLLPSFEFIKETNELTVADYGSLEGTYLEFHGDFAERKQGKLFLKKDTNKHLL